MRDLQLTHTVVMVSPNHFGFNPQTAESNVFQNHVTGSEEEIQAKAQAEFKEAVSKIEKCGITVLVLKSREDYITPDSIFPNNWFSHHSDGELVIYPMLAPNRRAERQAEKLKNLLEASGKSVPKIIDLSNDEGQACFLEGTGSLVLDREDKIAYAMESPRTVKAEFDKWCQIMGYKGVLFHAYDSKGFSIYHTNVTMSIGKEYAVICLDSIKDPIEREVVKDSLIMSGKEIIELSIDQIYKYCGNTLQLLSERGSSKIVMSKTAYDGFKLSQLEKLKKYGEIITVEIPEIETVGGGSARCMLAEVF